MASRSARRCDDPRSAHGRRGAAAIVPGSYKMIARLELTMAAVFEGRSTPNRRTSTSFRRRRRWSARRSAGGNCCACAMRCCAAILHEPKPRRRKCSVRSRAGPRVSSAWRLSRRPEVNAAAPSSRSSSPSPSLGPGRGQARASGRQGQAGRADGTEATAKAGAGRILRAAAPNRAPPSGKPAKKVKL